MTQTTGGGGLSAAALGGIGATVVVVGGAVMVWLGVFDRGADPVVPTGATSEVTITPSAQNPSIVSGTVIEPDPVSSQQDDATASVEGQASQTVAANIDESGPEPEPDQSAQNADVEPAQDTAVAQAVAPAVTESEAEVGTEASSQLETAADSPVQTTVETQPETSDAETSGEQNEVQPAATTEIETSTDQPAPSQSSTAEAAKADDQTAGQGSQAAQVESVADAAQSDDQSAATDGVAALAAPQLDLVRVDPTGETVIAGRATAGVQVSVLLDGEVLEQIDVDGGGEFVAFASIPPSDQARVISLRATADGQESLSESSFILAPAAPVPALADAAAASTTVAALDVAGAASVSAEGDTDGEPSVNTADATSAGASGSAEADNQAGHDAHSGADSDSGADNEGAPAQTGDAQAAPETLQAVDVAEAIAPAAEPSAPVQTPEPQHQEETTGTDAQLATAQSDAVQSSASEQTVDAELASPPQPEPAQVAVLRADATGVTLVQPASQAPLNKVVLDTISYSDSGEVQLAGRASADTQVRAYLNNAPVAEFDVASNGSWGGRLDAVNPGVYTLRLDELGADGKVISRLETPFKREAPEVLQAPASETTQTGAQAAPLVRAVTVQKGDTLWAISQERYGSGFLYVRVFEANAGAIRDPDLIYPGQVFTIPE